MGLLTDEHAWVRREASRALATLDAHHAAPDIVKLLVQADSGVRRSVAACLCLMGREDGVSILLEGPPDEDVDCMNALRSPAEWRRLVIAVEYPWMEGWRGLNRDFYEKLGSEIRRPIEFPTPPRRSELAWGAEISNLGTSPRELIRPIYALPVGPFRIVLEVDRIRCLRPGKALEFWKAWWNERRRRGK